ncbi:MAG: hypothetical protein QG635_1361 [Bacteroidota bacterium]|nr:hypothetical protein [Bacteroidota bacterium]
MLQYSAVNPPTLGLLKSLMKLTSLDNFYLAGGTSLALRFGHRISKDIDLFTNSEFSFDFVQNELNQFEDVNFISRTSNIYRITIKNIRVDLLSYNYQYIMPPHIEDSIRMLSVEDICAMKLASIANRGVKKDFFDLYFLLEKYNMKEIVQFFSMKYPNTDYYHVLKSLTFFEDAESNMDPIVIKTISWTDVKHNISKKVTDYFKQNSKS